MCTPSLAVSAEEAGQPYLLLERDERFSFLTHFQPFDLFNPTRVTEYKYDAIFCDPPFSNLELAVLRDALDVMPGCAASREAPLYIAYNSRREAELLRYLDRFQLEKMHPLTYCSVKAKTQQHLWLYGPHSDAR